LGTDTEAAITELRITVKAMRELGVVKFGDIELGPDPSAQVDTSKEDATQRSDRLEADHRRAMRLRFGASGGPRPVGSEHRR
jgi:hypothetical protein